MAALVAAVALKVEITIVVAAVEPVDTLGVVVVERMAQRLRQNQLLDLVAVVGVVALI
jgi:hypothetical protein